MHIDAERAELLTDLAAARSALVKTADGLTDDQAAARPTTSELCLGGLLKHVAAVEDGWLRVITDGPSAMSFELPDGVSWEEIMSGTAREYPQWMIERQQQFQVLPGETLAGILADYKEVCARTDRIVGEIADLDRRIALPAAPWGEPGREQSVRATLLHVIAETRQHAGHADIIREALDGQKST
ncbi:MAG TPA: DinB family protein [Pseudonocardiaceae bacterium]|jgi:uncharacterized damage-inducible protein DinB